MIVSDPWAIVHSINTSLFKATNLCVLLHRMSAVDNLLINFEDDVIQELKQFKLAGGGTICDLNVHGIRLHPKSLARISQETNINIVCGTGFFIDGCMPDWAKVMDIDELAKFMEREMTEGMVDAPGIPCGVIGEIGCSWPLTDNERKVLQAAAMAQQLTGWSFKTTNWLVSQASLFH